MAAEDRSQVAADTFDSEIGSAWVNTGSAWPGCAWVSGGHVQGGDAGQASYIRRAAGGYGRAQYSSVVLQTLSTGDLAELGAVILANSDNDSRTGYLGVINNGDWHGETAKYIIYKLPDYTVLASAGTAGAVSAGAIITLEVDDAGLLRLYTNEGGGDTLRVSVTDTDYTAGRPGAYCYGTVNANRAQITAWAGGTIGGEPAPPVPTITAAGTGGTFHNGETGVTLTGTNFGATRGSGTVYLSPTDDIDDSGRVEQTVTAWGNTSITITVVKGALSLETNLFLFVINDDDESNENGFVAQVLARAYVRTAVRNLQGALRASETGLTMVVWHALPTSGTPNPVQLLSAVSTNGAGQIDQQITRGALALNAPVWIAIMKDGSPAIATARKVTPVYE